MERLTGLPPGSDEEAGVGTDARERSELMRKPIRARILVIDDEPLFGQTMTMLLAQDEVVVECTGHGALRRLQSDGRFDHVLCDVSLPDLRGPEVYERVRQRNPELAERFVFVTGGAFTQGTREFLKRFPGARLEKPFALSDLEQVFDDARKRSARRAEEARRCAG